MQRARQVDVFLLPFSPAYDYNALKSFTFDGQRYRPGDPFPKDHEGGREHRIDPASSTAAPANGTTAIQDRLLLKLFKARMVYPLIPGVNIDADGTVTDEVAAARMGVGQARPGAAGSVSAPAGGKMAILDPPNSTAGHQPGLTEAEAADRAAALQRQSTENAQTPGGEEDSDLDPSEAGEVISGGHVRPVVLEEEEDLDPSELPEPATRPEPDLASDPGQLSPEERVETPRPPPTRAPATLVLGPGADAQPRVEPESAADPAPPAEPLVAGAKPWAMVHKGFGRWTITDAAGGVMRAGMDKETAEAALQSGVLPVEGE